mmetsp:Transcript_688/g.1871  ORF Transcript_688/g.1871 Transcript_688/m.1871 type:complete len:265 (+) Transcript_688:548-1342(+)
MARLAKDAEVVLAIPALVVVEDGEDERLEREARARCGVRLLALRHVRATAEAAALFGGVAVMVADRLEIGLSEGAPQPRARLGESLIGEQAGIVHVEVDAVRSHRRAILLDMDCRLHLVAARDAQVVTVEEVLRPRHAALLALRALLSGLGTERVRVTLVAVGVVRIPLVALLVEESQVVGAVPVGRVVVDRLRGGFVGKARAPCSVVGRGRALSHVRADEEGRVVVAVCGARRHVVTDRLELRIDARLRRNGLRHLVARILES